MQPICRVNYSYSSILVIFFLSSQFALRDCWKFSVILKQLTNSFFFQEENNKSLDVEIFQV
jgi:hypothetical protein